MAHQGMNLREAICEARAAGIEVETLRRTGELVFKLRGEPWVRINGRRKDVAREAVLLIRRAQARTRVETTTPRAAQRR